MCRDKLFIARERETLSYVTSKRFGENASDFEGILKQNENVKESAEIAHCSPYMPKGEQKKRNGNHIYLYGNTEFGLGLLVACQSD